MSIREEEEKKKPENARERLPGGFASGNTSNEVSPEQEECGWNTQESILGDKPYMLPNGEMYKKRVRTVMTPIQSESLRRYFRINPFPSSDVRASISSSLGMRPRTVQIWFQNQRQKMKHVLQEEERIKEFREAAVYTGAKEEEPLWVLAHLSCTVLNTNNAV
ncbi:uncharacterized protein NEMAJ01_1852 [Nematocida major]|uniref:uncharacterized protein n=1 Tax=Nematocida major TaxID=1912982 RepID=UPI0020087886|nr:uncharacterized protein NEMAJ01_1852 [Nematocida major]KAH9386956.1 hypothetical protein NEMAJ01_1852 [Nematocida major]